MNAEIKKLWCDALRSGDYPQGYGQLKTQTGYCCLGVLEKLAAERGLVKFVDSRPYLSPETMKWADLDNSNPPLRSEGGDYCAYLNDCGWSFTKIADRIEQNL